MKHIKPEEKLIKIVNTYFDVDVLKKSRDREVVDARGVCYKILYDEGYTKTRIAKIFNKHHATIIWGLKAIRDILKQDRMLNSKYNVCRLEFREEKSMFLLETGELWGEIIKMKKENAFLKNENKYLHSLKQENLPYDSLLTIFKNRVPPTKVGALTPKIKTLINGI